MVESLARALVEAHRALLYLETGEGSSPSLEAEKRASWRRDTKAHTDCPGKTSGGGREF